MKYKEIVVRFEKLHLIRRILHQKSTVDFSLYPGQLHLLEFVKRHIGCTQTEVAEHLMITPASVALSTKRMEKSGLLEKRQDPENLRCKRLYVTKKGKELSERNRKIIDEMDLAMFEDFSDEDLSTLANYLDRFLKNLSGKYSCNPDDIDFFSMCAMRKPIQTQGRKDSTNV